MKKPLKLNEGLKELSPDELLNVRGGGDIIDTMKCIAGTLGKGAGAVTTLVLGGTIWGMSRMAGVIAGCTK